MHGRAIVCSRSRIVDNAEMWWQVGLLQLTVSKGRVERGNALTNIVTPSIHTFYYNYQSVDLFISGQILWLHQTEL